VTEPSSFQEAVQDPNFLDHNALHQKCRKCTMEFDRLRLDATQNVGAPNSHCRHIQSPDRFSGYIALMRKCIVTEPSSFQKAV
jgi:hypothetical protein